MSALVSLFYLYDPWFLHFIRMELITGSIALLFLSYKRWNKSQKSVVIPKDSLIACIALLIISAIPLIINGTKEMGVLSMYVKSLFVFILGIAIYNLFYQHENGKPQLIRDLKMGIGVQAFIGFFALVGVPFIIDLATNTNSNMGGHFARFIGSEQEYRLYNLTSAAFFPLSVFYVLLLHFMLAYHARTQALNPIWLFLLLCIGLIAGRLFLTFSLVSCLLYFRWRYLPALLAFVALGLISMRKIAMLNTLSNLSLT